MLFLLPAFAGLPLQQLILVVIGILLGAFIGMTIHEFAHNYVGHLMGDPVPAREGRLTLNPAVHINWVGFLMFALIGFGFLGSAPIASYRMKNPRWGYLAAVAAGPFSNLLLAVVVAVLFRIVGFGSPFDFVLLMIVRMNILLFIFNLLPMFPLDGWYIVLSLLPSEQAYQWERYAQYSQFAFFALIAVSFVLPQGSIDPLSLILREPMDFFTRLLLG